MKIKGVNSDIKFKMTFYRIIRRAKRHQNLKFSWKKISLLKLRQIKNRLSLDCLPVFLFETFFFLVSDLTKSLLFLTPEKDRASYRNWQLNLNENHVKLFSSLMEHKLSKLTLERNDNYDLLSLVLIQLYLLKVNLLIMVR